MTTKICGLDFGTSNSTVSVLDGHGIPRLLPLEDGKVTIPSVLFFNFEEDNVRFGRRAVKEYVSGVDGRMMRSLKSILGSDLFDDRTRIKARNIAFTEILGIFIAHLRQNAQAAMDADIDAVVVGRPVRFVDDDDAADALAQTQLESAVRAEGFKHIAFQYEPIAAALDYEQQVAGEELALIVDIGGGTSDFTVIRLSPERARAADRSADILATAGVHIGGTDFDRLLSLAKAMPALGYQTPTRDNKRVLPSAPFYDLATWHRINRLYNKKTLSELHQTRNEARYPERVDDMLAIVQNRLGHALAGAVEESKIALTENAETTLRFANDALDLSIAISRADFIDAIDRAVSRVDDAIVRTLALAGIPASSIQTLMMTGGSTQIPAIMTRLHARFPQARFAATDAFGSVGLGLALDGKRKF